MWENFSTVFWVLVWKDKFGKYEDPLVDIKGTFEREVP